MKSTTSKWIRRLGLVLVSIGAFGIFLPMLVRSEFGTKFDWLMPMPLMAVLVFSPYVGIVLYFYGRFQKRP